MEYSFNNTFNVFCLLILTSVFILEEFQLIDLLHFCAHLHAWQLWILATVNLTLFSADVFVFL